jgi:hypothetical protein
MMADEGSRPPNRRCRKRGVLQLVRDRSWSAISGISRPAQSGSCVNGCERSCERHRRLAHAGQRTVSVRRGRRNDLHRRPQAHLLVLAREAEQSADRLFSERKYAYAQQIQRLAVVYFDMAQESA